MLQAHPHLELLDEVIRIFGWPAILGAIIWVVKTIQRGQHDFKEMGTNAKTAASVSEDVKVQVGLLQTNHMVHLQAGIDKIAASNDAAVGVLQDIKTNLAIVLDRNPR